MWFKNAQIFTVELSDQHLSAFNDEQKLEEILKAKAFRPCMAQEISTIGFAPVLGRHTNAFAFSNNHCHFMKLIEETKLLPSSVIKTALEDEIETQEAKLQRTLRKNEVQTLKTALTNKLLSQAFSAQREMLVMVNSQKGFCLVSVSSAKRAERAIAMLREAFEGTFPARHFQPRCVVEDKMTSYLSTQDLPQIFTLGFDATLKSSDEDGGVVKVSKEDLKADEILAHINAGKVVTEMQLTYVDSLSLVLTSELSLKRLRPEDLYLERNLPDSADDEAADAQANLILQGELLTSLTTDLKELFECE